MKIVAIVGGEVSLEVENGKIKLEMIKH